MPIRLIIQVVYFVAFSYLISGLSTTDILRLTSNQNLPIFTHDSYCSNCGYTIPLVNQLPIISHLLNKGRCRNCNAKIPVIQLIMECVLFVAFLLIGILTRFQKSAFVCGFLFYEILKLIVIICKGKRDHGFYLQLSISIVLNIIFFGFGYLFFCILPLLLGWLLLLGWFVFYLYLLLQSNYKNNRKRLITRCL